MSHLPAPDRTAVPTTRLWAEAVGYCDIRTINVSTSTTAAFTQPAIGASVTVAVATSTSLVPGDTVAISGSLATYRGGFYKVLSKPTTTSILAELITPGIAPGGTVAIGADCRSVTPIMVTPSSRGAFVVTDLYADSLACPGFGDTTRCTISIGWNKGGTPFSEFYSAQQLNFVTTLSSGTSAASLGAAFVQPAVGSSVSVRLATPGVYALGTWGFPLGTVLQVVRGGVYSVAGFTTTTTTANYTQPAVGSSVTINVASSTGFAVNDYLWVSTPTVSGAGVYVVTATTATSITCTLNNVGSSFLPGVASTTVIASGATVTHGQTFSLTLLRDSRLAVGQSVATGNSVFSWREGKATTTATFVQPTIGTTVLVTVADNRDLVVGTTVWLNVGFGSSAGIYSVTSKTGLNQVLLSFTTAIDYASGATVPVGAVMHVRRQGGQVLPLRTTGTTRLSVDPGAPIAAYVSVAGDPISCGLVAIHVRGYFVS
jgi:hypothetical protein